MLDLGIKVHTYCPAYLNIWDFIYFFFVVVVTSKLFWFLFYSVLWQNIIGFIISYSYILVLLRQDHHS